MNVVIVGGSLVGLMHGVMLKHHGCDVDILEQTAERMEGQAAGIGTGLHVKQFLDRHDRLKGSFAFPCHGARTVSDKDEVLSEIRVPMAMTSWDALYYRLRANFDGLKSVYNPEPPAQQIRDGQVSYQSGKKVISVESGGGNSNSSGKTQVAVRYKDVLSGQESTKTADLVIGADGANSTIRSLLSPKAPGRKYAGYVLWRGIVPEEAITSETTKKCNDWFTLCPIPQQNECLVLYPIPGKNGSLEAGHREINFAWYAHITPAELSEALVDVDGHKHQWSVPNGKLRPAVWQRQLSQAGHVLSGSAREIANKIEHPFLQLIGDQTAPQASFLDGKVLLVGDGLATLRPHTGAGISSGAFHALQLEKTLFEGENDKDTGAAVREWEQSVLEYSHMERLRSISWGEYYLGGWLGWLPAAMHYHGRLKLKAWYAWATNLTQGRP